jgi:Raf kinase inhibitor-like YbhB/YbcL family protein
MTARINLPWVAILFTGLLCSSCSNQTEPAVKGDAAQIQITSTVLQDGQPIPDKYTGHGDDVSPPLQWSGAPMQTKSLALICEDPDAPPGMFAHWLVYNLPPTTTSLDENVPKGQTIVYGFLQGKNGFGNIGYNGPNPPAGKVHHYVFKVYALDIILLLPGGGDRGDLLSAMDGHVIGEGELTGTYETGN